ncbi:DNA repair protein rad52 [Coemansia biformis]|uniref:DNA repair protein rad52 n=1 Tax=Coemansia biformis TaxID=1286918 RepID=A0A9W8CVX8_9FUNG|nr:DNA repair protein rad52 [Coemansia biformis]
MSQFPQPQARGDPPAAPSEHPFAPEDAQHVQAQLRKKLGPEHISTRQAMGSSRLSYVEGWRIISIANEIFGFDGWRSSIQTLNIDFMDAIDGGRFNIGASCVMRVTLRDGSYREDVGYGIMENAKSKGQALEKVKKEATTDALKRAMRQFGNVLGNCLYDKEYVRNLTHVQKQPRDRISGDALYRYSDLEGHGGVGNQSDNDMDFDLVGLDDTSVFDLVSDLETHRPIIFESPSFSYAAAAAGCPAPGATPSRVAGGARSSDQSAGSAASSGGGGGPTGQSRMASNGHPPSARNLSFHPPTPTPAQQGTPGQGRPRSFADITSFVPASASPGSAAAPTDRQHQQQPPPGP